MSCIAIITARGGSKRIPRKNVKDFCGKPIIAYSIEAALDSKLFDEVMISTDSEEIAEIARSYGANVPFMRSEKNSNDFATTDDVLLEVVREYEKHGHCYEEMCCIYPTAPFVTAKKLRISYKKFVESKADMLEPVVAFSYPPQRGLILKDGYLINRYPQYNSVRSQDLEEWYHDAGQFYFYKVDSFKKYLDGYNNNCYRIVPFELEEKCVQDIDNISDWELAEMKYKILVATGGLE